MRRRLSMAAGMAALAILAAACSSSSTTTHSLSVTHPPTVTGIEKLNAAATGAAAAANLNSSSNAPLAFPAGIWTGPVAVTVRPFTLPGGGGNNGNAAATVTLKTPAGNVTVHHGVNLVPGASNPNQPPPATWTKTGGQCHFTATFSRGTVAFISGTGKFAGATSTGPGSFAVTAQGYALLKPGQSKCSFDTIGPIQNGGAQVRFAASFPLTVKT
jgi:hypothetical protein